VTQAKSDSFAYPCLKRHTMSNSYASQTCYS